MKYIAKDLWWNTDIYADVPMCTFVNENINCADMPIMI